MDVTVRSGDWKEMIYCGEMPEMTESMAGRETIPYTGEPGMTSCMGEKETTPSTEMQEMMCWTEEQETTVFAAEPGTTPISLRKAAGPRRSTTWREATPSVSGQGSSRRT